MTGGGQRRLPVLGSSSDDIHGGDHRGSGEGFAPATADLGSVDIPLDSMDLQGSVVDRKPALGDLLDLDAFRDICASFVDLYKIGIKIFDVEGTKLVDIRVGNGDWCSYIFSNPTGRKRCTRLVTRIKGHDYDELGSGEIVEESCFSGLKYVVMPIAYGGDVLGRVIYGPFMPADLDAPAEGVRDLGGDFDLGRLWRYGDKVRRAPDETIMKILTNFRGVVDTVTFIAMKSVMTRQLHLESITASYNELSESNRKLRASVERLQEVDRMKSSFLAMVSHELKTPLTSVNGYSEMLIDGVAGEVSPEQKKYLGIIKDKGQNLLELIESLLDMSRMEAGHLELDLSTTTVGRLVEEAMSSVAPQAQKKDLDLRFTVSDRIPKVSVDAGKIRQVLVNLLGNAVKFTGRSGQIELRADVVRTRPANADPNDRFGPLEEDHLRIVVEDDGMGIPENALGKIFDSFYQVDASITREHGGSGLGLAITKKLIEAHGGVIKAESQVGVGTRFTLLIPLEKVTALV